MAAAALLAGVVAPSGAAAAPPPSLDIAYGFAGAIHVMRADGSGDVRLTSPALAGFDVGDGQPAWSPDGSRLAFARALPPPGLPATLLRRLRRTERAYRRAGTVEDAARVLGVDRRVVSRRLRFARAIHALPRVRGLRCNRR